MTTTFGHAKSVNYTLKKSVNDANGNGTLQFLAYTPKPNKSSTTKRNGGKLNPGLDSLAKAVEFTDIADQPVLDQPPPDRYRMVFFIFLIHGVAILMPWNMFITAKSYFEDYKLDTPISAKATYRSEFMFYLGIVSQVSSVVISCFNTFFQFGQQASTRRIAIVLFMMVILFIFTVILAMIDTSNMPLVFFGLTMASVSVLNCCTGVYQNSTFGLAAALPMKYTNAIVLGTNLSGVFTSVINILSIAGSPNPRTSAVYYFIVAIVVLLVAFDCYFLLPLTKFYQYYLKSIHGSASDEEKNMTCGDYVRAFLNSCKIYWQVIKKIRLHLFGVWCTFCVSFILFPAIQSNIKMVREKSTADNVTEIYTTITFSEEFVSKGYWTSIFTFLSFNLFAFLGNVTSEWIKWPGPRHVWIPIVLRAVILIPVYIFCNYHPVGFERRFPVYIPSNIVFIMAGIVTAFTSGYYSSLTMMYGPKEVEPSMMSRAGLMMSFFLVLGITSGVNLSLGLQRLITIQTTIS